MNGGSHPSDIYPVDPPEMSLSGIARGNGRHLRQGTHEDQKQRWDRYGPEAGEEDCEPKEESGWMWTEGRGWVV